MKYLITKFSLENEKFNQQNHYSYRTENKIEKQKKSMYDYDYCYLKMSNEDNKILKYNYGENSMKTSLGFMLT